MSQSAHHSFLISRAVTTVEAAQLLGFGPRYFHTRYLSVSQMDEIDSALNNGPHAFIATKQVLPEGYSRWRDCRRDTLGCQIGYWPELAFGPDHPIDPRRRYVAWLRKAKGAKLSLIPVGDNPFMNNAFRWTVLKLGISTSTQDALHPDQMTPIAPTLTPDEAYEARLAKLKAAQEQSDLDRAREDAFREALNRAAQKEK